MKKKFIDYYMSIAMTTSQLSYATRLKVGSVIVKNHQIIGTGYNGMPSGWDNNCEHKQYNISKDFNGNYSPDSEKEYPLKDDLGQYRLKTKQEVLHSEMNALMKVTRSTESSEGAIMFCTHAPCIECAKAIYQSGISTLFYKEPYRSDDGLKFLSQGKVNVHRYEV